MKIVYLSYASIPSRKANSVHIMKMCSALAGNGHDVILVHPNAFKEEEAHVEDVYQFYGVKNNFKINKITSWPALFKFLMPVFTGCECGLFIFKACRRIFYPLLAARQIRKFKPDLIYSRYIPGHFWSASYSIHNIIESHAVFGEMKLLSRYFLRSLIKKNNFKRLVTISKALYDNYKNKCGLPDEKLVLAPDGADPVISATTNKIMGNNKFNVGYCGHLYKGRGIEIIIKLASELTDIGFHIIGGNEKDIKFWKEKYSNSENIFFYGFVPPDEVPGYLLSFDVLLAPYQKDTATQGGIVTTAIMSPLKIFEYMATGKPIVCSDLPALKEVLENNKNAIMCDPDNSEEWNKALLLLKNNESLRREIGDNAKNLFLSEYTWTKRAERILEGI